MSREPSNSNISIDKGFFISHILHCHSRLDRESRPFRIFLEESGFWHTPGMTLGEFYAYPQNIFWLCYVMKGNYWVHVMSVPPYIRWSERYFPDCFEKASPPRFFLGSTPPTPPLFQGGNGSKFYKIYLELAHSDQFTGRRFICKTDTYPSSFISSLPREERSLPFINEKCSFSTSSKSKRM